MPQVRPVAKIHAAATYFVFVSRDPRQIADAFNLKNVRTVHRWAETPEWTEILDICRYTGDRTFQHQPTRKIEQDLFSKARAVYVASIAEGIPKHKLATLTAEKTGLNAGRIRSWAKKDNWGAENTA